MAKKRATKTSKLAGGKTVETIVHDEASRLNIPTAEYQSVMENEAKYDTRVSYQRRNRDLDPQLMWRGKDEQDLSDLVVNVPPIYIQEKVHPKVLIDDLLKKSQDNVEKTKKEHQLDLFSDFNGLPDTDAKTEFYQHESNWTNRMILGDSLQVMASLADREGLRGKVQCIYFDPPYGIKFNSNFQWSTTSRDVKDGNTGHITLKSIANNTEIDVIWDKFQEQLEPLREQLNKALKQKWEEWEIPREADEEWSADAKKIHSQWWKLRIKRQKEIDASISAKAEYEYLYDKPYEDKKKVRVAGPFTVESLSPHRSMIVGVNDELIDPVKTSEPSGQAKDGGDFVQMILENLKSAGVQQAHK